MSHHAVAAAPPNPAVARIFKAFDANRDGVLDEVELQTFVRRVNPGVAFSSEQLAAILDEIHRAYVAGVHAGARSGLTLAGLDAAYADGLGDAAADLRTLGLTVEEDDKGRAACGFGAGGRAARAKASPSSARIIDVAACGCTGPRGGGAPLWRPADQRTPSPGAGGNASPAGARPGPLSCLTAPAIVASGCVGRPATAATASTPVAAATPDARIIPGSLLSPPGTARSNVESHALTDFSSDDDINPADGEADELAEGGLEVSGDGASEPMRGDSEGGASAGREEDAFVDAPDAGAADADAPGAADAPDAADAFAPRTPASASAAASELPDDDGEAASLEDDAGFDVDSATPAPAPAVRAPDQPPATPAAAAVAALHAELAPALAARPDAAAAAAALDAAAAWAAPDARTLLRLGNALYALGEAGAAEAAYEAGLVAAADDAAAAGGAGGAPPSALLVPKLHVNLGIALEAQGLLDDAAAAYAAAVGADPAHARAHKLLGSVRYALGSYDAAAASLQAALALDPEYADARCDLGCALCALGRGDDAGAAFEGVLAVDAGHREALFNLAGLRRQWGQWDDAAALYRRLLALDPGHWRARLGLAVTLAGAGRGDAARDELQAALRTPGTDRDVVEKELDGLKQLAASRRAGAAVVV